MALPLPHTARVAHVGDLENLDRGNAVVAAYCLCCSQYAAAAAPLLAQLPVPVGAIRSSDDSANAQGLTQTLPQNQKP